MTESYSKEHDLKLKSINSVLTQYKEILSETVAPITETIQASMSSSLQALIDKIDEIQQMYQPVIDSAVLHIDEFIPKFDSLINNLSEAITQINYDKCSEKDVEDISLSTKNIEEIKTTVKTRELSIGEWIGIVELIVTIFFGILSLMPDSQLEQLHQDNVTKNQYLKQFTEDFHDFSETLQKHLEITQTQSGDIHTLNLNSDSEVE